MESAEQEKFEPLPGFEVIKLHFSVDPEATRKAMAQKSQLAPEDWEREHNLKPVGNVGSYPVFSGWNRRYHEDDSLIFRPAWGSIYRGWDFGKVRPAVEFFQASGRLVNGIDEVTDEAVDLPNFCAKVLAHCSQRYPRAQFIDRCDPSGRNEKDTGKSSVKVLKENGIFARFRTSLDVEESILNMTKLIMQLDPSGRPLLVINPRRQPHLAAAVRGGYRRNKKGDIIKDGQHDHFVDATRYALVVAATLRNVPGQFGRLVGDIHTEKARNYHYQPKNPVTGY